MVSPIESLDERLLFEENIETTFDVVDGAYTSTCSMIVGNRSMICVNAVIRVICDACLAKNEVVRECNGNEKKCGPSDERQGVTVGRILDVTVY